MDTLFKGRLERWNDDKGFGFILPEQVKDEVFIHISALKNMPRRPVVGDVIYYQLHVGNDGKTKAVNAKIEGIAVVRCFPFCFLLPLGTFCTLMSRSTVLLKLMAQYNMPQVQIAVMI